MKLRTLLTTIALGTASLALAPARAQTVDPCTVYMCMAGISGVGASGGPACSAATDVFFDIAIFDPYFDAPDTAAARRQYLMTCPGATTATNAAILETIIATWFAVP